MLNIKTIKFLIGLFLGILCFFFALMGLERCGSKKPMAEVSAGAKADGMTEGSARPKEDAAVFYRTGLTTESVRSEGAIMIIKSEEFEGVAEDAKSVMDILTDMSGSNKKKTPPIYLTDKDFDKKIAVDQAGVKAPLNASAVPKLGQNSFAAGGKAMISAPVDYQVFSDSETWRAFASTHKGRFPAVDFAREEMLILVSVSELPSGIFKIDGLRKSAKETVLLYRVDPLAMAANSAANEQNFYSAAAIPKAIDVKLEQIP